MAFLALGCSDKDEFEVSSDIVGKWKLIEVYADPGDGSGKFRPLKSDKVLDFSKNGNFRVVNGDICNINMQSKGSGMSTYTIDSTEIKDHYRLKINHCNLEFSCYVVDDVLTIYYSCIEGCGERFRRVN